MPLQSGSKLGPYEILGLIGAGGMGEVYRAMDPRLGREVAIKVLPASFSAEADRLRRFEQEARAAGILNHPNITAVYDIGSHEGAPYVVQELLEGETLRSALAVGRLSPRKAVDHSLQIAHGLAAAHEKGIVHRDLKPENLFVTRDGRVKILDFGLAKLTHQEEGSQATNLPTAAAGTEPGVVLGTLGYMAPEQVRGRKADARSDIFSFGAILFEMLSGRRAFHGDSAADTMSAILKEDPPDLSVTNQAISPGLERIVRHCLEKNPEQRFHSAHDLAFDLEALSGVSGAAAAAPAAAARSLRTSTVLLVSGAVLLALAAAAAGLFAGRMSRSTRPSPTFHRITFRRGFINSARFASDGQTIAYAAAWDGRPLEIFTTRAGAAESRSLSLPGADVFAISKADEIAIRLRRPLGIPDMLAQVSLAGGSARDLLENVIAADWSLDGKSLAVIRVPVGKPRSLEFPIGKVLYSSLGLTEVRVAPDGRSLAINESEPDGSSISIVDLSGKARRLTASWSGASGLAWSPDGREIWFTFAPREGPPNLFAVDLAGKVRPVLRMPGWLWLQDIAPDGRVLLTINGWRAGLNWMRPGDAREHDVSWLDWSLAEDLSADGRQLLFSEDREGGGTEGTVFLRRDPQEPPVRLGAGIGLALSPDAKWVLADVPASEVKSRRLMLLPTGAGEPKTLQMNPVVSFSGARWLRDGKQFLLRGAERNGQPRVYLCALDGEAPRAVTPEGTGPLFAVSPDSKAVAARVGDALKIFALEGGTARDVPGQNPGESAIAWSAAGRSLFVYRAGEPPARVYRLDIESGKRELWKEIAPPDAAGIERVSPILLTPDARGYVYTYQRRSSDLYVVEGLK
jgi:Tol biopolymer transport system component